MAASAFLLSMPTVILLIAAAFAETPSGAGVLVACALVLLGFNALLLRIMKRWARSMMDSEDPNRT